jgi:hypothetical protein
MSKSSRKKRETLDVKTWEETDRFLQKIDRLKDEVNKAVYPADEDTFEVVNPYLEGSVEWTVRDCIGYYPTLYSSRTKTLYHVFLISGCGFHWRQGQLIDPYIDQFKIVKRWRISSEEVERRANLRTKCSADSYVVAMHAYLNLFQIPSNIQPDWLKAAKELLEDVDPAQFEGLELPSVLL